MEADPAKLIHRNSFNVTAMSFDPEMIAAEIRKHIPGFVMDYNVEPMKQGIANSWPNSMDDSCARNEWNWKPNWNLESMTVDMLRAIREKKDKGLI
jgi:nucleoside-diphosphate-sugar epimerase